MSKRRTKKQKTEAKHNLMISWHPSVDPGEKGPKKQNQKHLENQKGSKKTSVKKKIVRQSVDPAISSTKKAIAKSLGLAGFILSLEIMIYLFL